MVRDVVFRATHASVPTHDVHRRPVRQESDCDILMGQMKVHVGLGDIQHIVPRVEAVLNEAIIILRGG